MINLDIAPCVQRRMKKHTKSIVSTLSHPALLGLALLAPTFAGAVLQGNDKQNFKIYASKAVFEHVQKLATEQGQSIEGYDAEFHSVKRLVEAWANEPWRQNESGEFIQNILPKEFKRFSGKLDQSSFEEKGTNTPYFVWAIDQIHDELAAPFACKRLCQQAYGDYCTLTASRDSGETLRSPNPSAIDPATKEMLFKILETRETAQSEAMENNDNQQAAINKALKSISEMLEGDNIVKPSTLVHIAFVAARHGSVEDLERLHKITPAFFWGVYCTFEKDQLIRTGIKSNSLGTLQWINDNVGKLNGLDHSHQASVTKLLEQDSKLPEKDRKISAEMKAKAEELMS